jgi:hypothetical protein
MLMRGNVSMLRQAARMVSRGTTDSLSAECRRDQVDEATGGLRSPPHG